MFFEKMGSNMDHRSCFSPKSCSSQIDLSNELSAPQTEIVCKSYAPGKLTYQLPPSGPTNLLAFHLPGLGFWILLMLKRPLEPHCNNHLLTDASSHHISSQR
jgi:hypothetical protein